ncbi:hypothetical protein ILP97_12750 [Amycolatopsis sp. H6(2020)]|nr:hypothetical protein [Amycolatopsis sp. H6(2020)]
MKLLRVALAAVFVCGVVSVPWHGVAFGLTQDSAAIHCDGVQLAPAPLDSKPDLNPDGTPVKITPDRRGKFVPVIMVHGWTGSSTHTSARTGKFSRLIDLSTNQLATVQASRSLIGQLQRNIGTAVFTFDYSEYSARWVDDAHIGPALGDAIDCLYRATGEKVIIVAHSMGGLATRYALAQRGPAGTNRAAETSTVVTLGTPETGSLVALLLATAADIGAVTNSALAVLRLVLAACGSAASGSLTTGTPCDILPPFVRAADSEAARALRTGSNQLADLPAFPRGVAVHALYGDTVFTVPKAGWFHMPWDVDKIPMGDLVVMPDSATHGVALAQKASCSYQLSPVRATTDAIGLVLRTTAKNDVAQPFTSAVGACYHDNLMRTIQLTNEATGIVNDDVSSRSPRTKVVKVVPVDKHSNPAAGWKVANQGETVDCSFPDSYPSPASVGRDIVLCSPTAAAADICWVKPDRVTVLCGREPWEKTLYRNVSSAPIGSVQAASAPEPWALELDGGVRCRIRNGGSWSGRSDNLVGAYSCDHGSDVVLVPQEDGAASINKTSPLWTVQLGVLDDKQSGSPPPRTVSVLTAYLAASP